MNTHTHKKKKKKGPRHAGRVSLIELSPPAGGRLEDYFLALIIVVLALWLGGF